MTLVISEKSYSYFILFETEFQVPITFCGVWQVPWKLFGFSCRAHAARPDGTYDYVKSDINGKYSIILPGTFSVFNTYG